MKKNKFHYVLFSGILLITSATYAQNTYPFPASGSVGIGTASPAPTSKLHVVGNARISDVQYPMLYLSSDNTNQPFNAVIHLDGYGSTPTGEIRFGRYLKSNNQWDGNPFVVSMLAPSGAFVMNQLGNLGLGVYPQARLHVYGEARIADVSTPMIKLISDAPSATYSVGIYYDPTNEVRFGRYLKSTNTWQSNPFRFSVEAPEGSFVMTNQGKIAIGISGGATTKLNETNCKLFVAGGIMTEKIKVMGYANWADYVFTKEYKLTPLKEVEKFISENNHLSEIPSAKEIEANGLDLAEISRLQMQKIEELTLYLIEQSKQIESLKKEVNELKSN